MSRALYPNPSKFLDHNHMLPWEQTMRFLLKENTMERSSQLQYRTWLKASVMQNEQKKLLKIMEKR